MLTLRARGLHTFENPNVAPEGALQVATNVVIARQDIIEPRRGLPVTGGTFPSGGHADAAVFFASMLVVHTTSNKIAWADPTANVATWTELSGTYLPPTGQTMRFTQANNNLYFTTSTGLFKIDQLSNTPALAGGIKGLPIQAAQTGLTGFMSANSQVGYRVVWGYRDANNNVIFGVPSSRVVMSGFANAVAVAIGGMVRAATTVTVTATAHGYVTNDVVYLQSTDPQFPGGTFTITVTGANTFTYTQSGQAVTSTIATNFYYATRNVSITIPFPAAVTVNSFLQVYRTAGSVDGNTDPGDEMGQVYEYTPTQADVTAKTYTFTELVPDALRGTTLYTSPSQGGLVNGFERPPLCNDVETFKGALLCANTTPYQRLYMTLLSVDATSGGMANGDQINIVDIPSDTGFAVIAAAAEGALGTTNFKRFTTGTSAQNIANTAQSIVKMVNARTNNATVTAYYMSGPDDVPGKIMFEAKALGAGAFIVYGGTVAGATFKYWSPNLTSVVVTADTPMMSRTAGVVTVGGPGGLITTGALAVGQAVYVWPDPSSGSLFPAGLKYIATIPDGTHFTYLEAGANGTSNGVYGVASYARTISTAVIGTNVLAWSAPGQPEAHPLLNNQPVGSSDDTLLRIVKLRDYVYLFMAKSGVYRLSGTDPSNFRIDLFDASVKLVGPSTTAVVNNEIFCLSTLGVVAINDGGVRVVSQPIKADAFNLLVANIAQVKALSFGIGYESERQYILYTTSPTDTTKAAQAYVYSLDSNAWTLWDVPASFGLVDPVADVLYLGHPTLAQVRLEAKTRTYADYYDGTVAVTITGSTASTVTLTSAAGVAVGDLLTQGASVATVTKIVSNTLTVAPVSVSWNNAAATVYSAFQSQVQWVPQPMGDPAASKDVFAALLLMGDARFNTAALEFITDASTNWEGSTTVPGTSGINGTMKSLPIPVDVPQEKHACSNISPRFTIKNARGAWLLQGLQLTFNRVGAQPVR